MKNNINKESPATIKSMLANHISKIYHHYEYLDLDYAKYDDIVQDLIIKAKDNNTGEDLLKTIEKSIYKKMDDIVKTELASSNKVILNYINLNINKSDRLSDAYRYYNQLYTFCNKYNYNFSIDLIINLLDNNKSFAKMVKILYESNIKRINEGEISDDFLESLIDAYCIVNNIDTVVIEDDLKKEAEYLAKDDDSGDIDPLNTYIKEINKKPLLTYKEEKELFQKMNDGDLEAREKIIESNLKLVVSIARRYHSNQMQLLDKIQEGTLGLMKAVDKFDVNKNYKFSTYATWWIRQAVGRSIEDYDRTIKLPVYLILRIKKMVKEADLIAKEKGAEATVEEIAERMNLKVEEIVRLKKISEEPISINTIVGDDNDAELGDFIPNTEVSIEEDMELNLLSEEFRKLIDLSNLTDREKKVIALRYGLDGSGAKTLEQVGKVFNVTRERIRQIQNKALNKLRCNSKMKNYSSYLDFPEQSMSEFFKLRYNNYGNRYGDKKEDKGTKEGEDNMVTMNIYQYFNGYPKKRINEVIESLCDEDKELLEKRYGKDLNNPIETSLTKEEYAKFYGSLIPKIKRRLEGKKVKTTLVKKNKKEEVEPIIVVNPAEPKSQQVRMINPALNLDNNENNSTEIVDAEVVEVEIEQPEDKELQLLLPLFQMPAVLEEIKKLSPIEATIIYLKLGYINGKSYSTEEIANFLNITTSEVREVTRVFLKDSKNIINSSLDNMIDGFILKQFNRS